MLNVGAIVRPLAFTLTGVSSMNGSDSDAKCPSVCRMTGASNERFCDCNGLMSAVNGTLIDGIIPTFDVNQRGTWASQLYTVDTTTTSYAIGFRFSSQFMLQEVELSIFLCTPWFIPRAGLTINIHKGIVFPAFTSTTPIGSRALTLSNCVSLETIYITTSPTGDSRIYFIEFTNSATVRGIYIGEVIFRDQTTQDQVCKSDRILTILYYFSIVCTTLLLFNLFGVNKKQCFTINLHYAVSYVVPYLPSIY